MEDDIERGEKLKQELVREGWGGESTLKNMWQFLTDFLENEIKHAMQKEEMQYRLAILISSRAQSNREHIREIVQESGFY